MAKLYRYWPGGDRNKTFYVGRSINRVTSSVGTFR